MRHFSMRTLVNTIISWSIIKHFISLFGLVIMLEAGLCKDFIMCELMYCTVEGWPSGVCCLFYLNVFSEELDVLLGGWFHGMILFSQILWNFYSNDKPQQTTHAPAIFDVENKYCGYVKYNIVSIIKVIRTKLFLTVFIFSTKLF